MFFPGYIPHRGAFFLNSKFIYIFIHFHVYNINHGSFSLIQFVSRCSGLIRFDLRCFGSIRFDLRYFSLIRFVSGCSGLIRFDLRRFALIQFDLKYFNLIQFVSRYFGLIRTDYNVSVWCGLIWDASILIRFKLICNILARFGLI